MVSTEAGSVIPFVSAPTSIRSVGDKRMTPTYRIKVSAVDKKGRTKEIRLPAGRVDPNKTKRFLYFIYVNIINLYTLRVGQL